MPGYTFVPIQKDMSALKDIVDGHKKKGTYAGSEENWDKEVISYLKKHCANAEKQAEAHLEYVLERRNRCKGLIEGIEARLKNKNRGDADYDWIAKQPAEIARLAKEIADDGGALVDALIEYRGGWPATAKETLSEKAQDLVQPFKDTRQKGINERDKTAVGYRERCKEYVTRATEFAKLAAQLQKKGDVNVGEFREDVAEIKKKMKDGGDAILKLIDQKKGTVTTVIAFGARDPKKDPVKPDELKVADGLVLHYAAAAKEARGSVKTLKVLLNGLETRGNAAGPGWKEEALKAVKNAKDEFKKAEEASETITENEAKLKKILEKLKKK
jgi:hypothetical protein